MEVNRIASLDPRKTFVLFSSHADALSLCPVIVAGSGKSVLWFVDSSLPLSEVTDVSYQFHYHPRYQGYVQDRKCVDGLFLF